MRVSSKVRLPAAAAIDGCETLAALGDRLIEARHDVGSLTTAELMRADYKEVVIDAPAPTDRNRTAEDDAPPTMRVGVAALFVPMEELLQRSGGVAGLEAAMVEAAGRREGLSTQPPPYR